ncbi:hypothetical protein HBB16_03115 [Pseudonocardia sp. MCCB 268]|nr:hypothetical protein [Pseudonocardia cytotoxica]
MLAVSGAARCRVRDGDGRGSALVAERRWSSATGGRRPGTATPSAPQLVFLLAGVAVVDLLGFAGCSLIGGSRRSPGGGRRGSVRGSRHRPGTLGGPRPHVEHPGPATPGSAGHDGHPVGRGWHAGRVRHPREWRHRLPAAPVVAMLVTCSTAQAVITTFAPGWRCPARGSAVPGGPVRDRAGALLGRESRGRVLTAAAGPGSRYPSGRSSRRPDVALAAPLAPALLRSGRPSKLGSGWCRTTRWSPSPPRGPLYYGAASAAWNIAYDAGPGSVPPRW